MNEFDSQFESEEQDSMIDTENLCLICRYKTMLNRQFYQIIDRLEKLQSNRKPREETEPSWQNLKIRNEPICSGDAITLCSQTACKNKKLDHASNSADDSYKKTSQQHRTINSNEMLTEPNGNILNKRNKRKFDKNKTDIDPRALINNFSEIRAENRSIRKKQRWRLPMGLR